MSKWSIASFMVFNSVEFGLWQRSLYAAVFIFGIQATVALLLGEYLDE